MKTDSDNEDDNVDSSLPYGAYPVQLSRKTQEVLECMANWDVSVFEPLKFVPATEVKEDLETPVTGIYDEKVKTGYTSN